jgi:hypothetical protein
MLVLSPTSDCLIGGKKLLVTTPTTARSLQFNIVFYITLVLINKPIVIHHNPHEKVFTIYHLLAAAGCGCFGPDTRFGAC